MTPEEEYRTLISEFLDSWDDLEELAIETFTANHGGYTMEKVNQWIVALAIKTGYDLGLKHGKQSE